MTAAKSSEKPAEPRRSQVSLKTIFTALFAVVVVWATVEFVTRTLVALTLTVVAMMLAIAMNHGVAWLQERRIPRTWSIVIVVVGGLVLASAVGFIVIPPAITQGKALVVGLPEMLKIGRASRAFQSLDAHLHIANRLQTLERQVPQMLEEAAAPLLTVLGGVVSGAAAVVAVLVLALFMLVFGGHVVRALLGETMPERRPIYEGVIEKSYRSIGGYLLGLGLICAVNATATTIFLAVVGIPFFLPLGIVSGMSSLIPYAGPAVVGSTVSLVALATGGPGRGIACVIYFLAYGQLEGQVLAPLIFRRTVHVNPLVVFLSILFFGELGGIVGAVLAVPTAATLQIVLRELLRMRRKRLHLPVTALNAGDETTVPPES